MIMEYCWNGIDGKAELLGGELPVLVPLCQPQISYELATSRTRVSAVRGRCLSSSCAKCLEVLFLFFSKLIAVATALPGLRQQLLAVRTAICTGRVNTH